METSSILEVVGYSQYPAYYVFPSLSNDSPPPLQIPCPCFLVRFVGSRIPFGQLSELLARG